MQFLDFAVSPAGYLGINFAAVGSPRKLNSILLTFMQKKISSRMVCVNRKHPRFRYIVEVLFLIFYYTDDFVISRFHCSEVSSKSIYFLIMEKKTLQIK